MSEPTQVLPPTPVVPEEPKKFVTRNRILIAAAVLVTAVASAFVARSELFATDEDESQEQNYTFDQSNPS